MNRTYGKNIRIVKQDNIKLVLSRFLFDGCNSRISLARATRLSKMTVSNLVNELLEQHYLCETDAQIGSDSGRPPMTLELHPESPQFLDVNVSREILCVTRVNLRLEPITRKTVTLANETQQSLSDKLVESVQQVLDYCANPILGIGVAAPGPVDAESGVILQPPNFFGIHDFPIVRFLSERFSLPASLFRDGNAYAAAEKRVGAGRQFRSFLLLLITKGVGGGIVENGRLLAGNSGGGGEIGHVSIDMNGEPCYCGNRGCLETYVNTDRALELLNADMGTQYTSLAECLSALAPEQLHNPVLYRILDTLAVGLTNAVNILDTEAVIFGGAYCRLADCHLAYLEEQLRRRAFSAGRTPVRVLRSRFAEHYLACGGACCLLNEVLADG